MENWHGLHGLSWSISPAAYWTAFEFRSGDSYYGAMTGGTSFGAPNPLAKYAYSRDLVSWFELNDAGLGVRVQGDAAVPEPSTLSLVLGGIIGLIARSRRMSL